ncbi:fungal protein [Ophiostoma piceae UAMH 11346]|uniref:Fungal protein n=1 Tax=Ophiostoma piceae (strain UAMH 11346) TaxID=1262450 RepID=S3C5Q0_OPHP1|nr:fungal protein [Ophiostoma piceae UAMH 11346]
MKWHRNPFFHTAVLPPSVAPSAMASARPSADLDSATAAAVRAAATRGSPGRTSTDVQQPPPPPQIQTQPPKESASPTSLTPTPLPPTTQQRVSFQEPRASLQLPQQEAQPRTSLNLHQQQQRASFQLPRRHSSQHSQSPPNGILAEAANRVAHGGSKPRRRKKVAKLTICEPSDHLTPYQAFYIFGIDGLGAFLLSGGINFAIGYAMYKTIDTDKHPIRLFQFPNTLAGDATVTIFIQTIMTWFIELVLVNRDLRSGHIQPIGFIKEPSNALVRWFLLLDRRPPKAAASSGSDEEASGDGGNAELSAPHDENCRCEKHVEQYEPGSWKHWAVFLVSQLLRALVVSVLMFMIMWAPTIGILAAIGDKRGGDWSFDGTSWAPPLFKLIYGGVLAALTTPPFAAFWLVRCGWALQANERHLEVAVASA